jgi:hypothetical protein
MRALQIIEFVFYSDYSVIIAFYSDNSGAGGGLHTVAVTGGERTASGCGGETHKTKQNKIAYVIRLLFFSMSESKNMMFSDFDTYCLAHLNASETTL